MLRRLITVGLLGAVLATPLRADAGVTTDPHYNEPTVGACHQYPGKTINQASDTSAPVPCRTKHNAKVFKVFQLPSTMDWTATPTQIGKLVAKRCDPAFKTWLGRNDLTRALTAYSYAWYAPTQAEKDLGARWLRCDIILHRGTGIAPLPINRIPMIPKPLNDKVRRCLVGKNYHYTVCNAKHQWRATGDFKIALGRYPSLKRFQKISASRCPRLVSSRGYLYQRPTKSQWKSGYRIMVCYTKTRR